MCRQLELPLLPKIVWGLAGTEVQTVAMQILCLSASHAEQGRFADVNEHSPRLQRVSFKGFDGNRSNKRSIGNVLTKLLQ